jgi:uncharacterized protein YcgI (DUF1989 family)
MRFDPPGTRILPAARGAAFRLPAGGRVRIVNPHGTQAVDLWAFAMADPDEFLSMDHLRSVNSVVAVDRGTRLVSNRRRPMLSIVEDTSAGRHDTLLCPCNASLYEELGCVGYHRSCADNLHEGLAAIGIEVPFTPASLNLFMSVRVEPDGTITRLLPSSRPGSHVLLRAEMDLVLALSSCPQDVTTINGPDRTPRDCAVEIVEVAPAGEPA